MNLRDLVHRPPLAPWQEADNLPWDEPEFSRRMLREHLSQEHDLASRRLETVERQVAWIDERILEKRATRILDLACGPGFYTRRLAERGHECVGIDFAPAAIEHAREETAGLPCHYRQEDVRQADLGSGFGLVMMLYGQINVFRPEQARALLTRAARALAPGGTLLLEPQRAATVERTGSAAPSWGTHKSGLFSESPHVMLAESLWDEATRTATQRFLVVDTRTAGVASYSLTTQAYSEDDLRAILTAAGLVDVEVLPSLVGSPVEDESMAANLVVVGRTPGLDELARLSPF